MVTNAKYRGTTIDAIVILSMSILEISKSSSTGNILPCMNGNRSVRTVRINVRTVSVPLGISGSRITTSRNPDAIRPNAAISQAQTLLFVRSRWWGPSAFVRTSPLSVNDTISSMLNSRVVLLVVLRLECLNRLPFCIVKIRGFYVHYSGRNFSL